MPERNTGDSINFTVMKVGNELYALDISCINEIVRMQHITEVPDTKDYVKGVMNLRGKIVPVLSLTMKLKLDDRGYSRKTRIVIVNFDDDEVGLIVDEVCKVKVISQAAIEPATEQIVGKNGAFLHYVFKSEEGIIGVLNLETLLGS